MYRCVCPSGVKALHGPGAILHPGLRQIACVQTLILQTAAIYHVSQVSTQQESESVMLLPWELECLGATLGRQDGDSLH